MAPVVLNDTSWARVRRPWSFQKFRPHSRSNVLLGYMLYGEALKRNARGQAYSYLAGGSLEKDYYESMSDNI